MSKCQSKDNIYSIIKKASRWVGDDGLTQRGSRRYGEVTQEMRDIVVEIVERPLDFTLKQINHALTQELPGVSQNIAVNLDLIE